VPSLSRLSTVLKSTKDLASAKLFLNQNNFRANKKVELTFCQTTLVSVETCQTAFVLLKNAGFCRNMPNSVCCSVLVVAQSFLSKHAMQVQARVERARTHLMSVWQLIFSPCAKQRWFLSKHAKQRPCHLKTLVSVEACQTAFAVPCPS